MLLKIAICLLACNVVHFAAENDNESTKTIPSRVLFRKFLRSSEINAYLNKMARQYPDRAYVKTVGSSYEGRDLKTITITNGDGRNDKKVIFIDAGIHAREWIAPAAALYVVQQLVEYFEVNVHLVKDYDWIVLPLVNPDGYEYSHSNSEDSLIWRKTRQPVNSECKGTDGNRNFDFHWGEVGASSFACSNMFKGVTAFSEPETRAVRDIMHSVDSRAKMYLSLHSFGRRLIYPWSYTRELPETWQDLDEVAQAGAAAIKAATGHTYQVGNSFRFFGAIAGSSDDYAYGKVNIPISITMELPEGEMGFIPTSAQIEPFIKETWIGIKAMAEKVIQKYSE